MDISSLSWLTFRSSTQTRPTTRDVVVAIAGIILPAIPLVWNKIKDMNLVAYRKSVLLYVRNLFCDL